MSTNATIQRMTPAGPIGTYHHWDGYPDGLGATLWSLWHGHFAGDTERMLHVLIDEHPAGWSTINQKDFNLTPGYNRDPAPACYCHGGRSEDGRPFPLESAAASGCEFAYVFYPETQRLKILSSYSDNGRKMVGMFGQGDPDAMWYVLADVGFNDAEPEWSKL